MTDVERGQALKALRTAAGLTQKQVADHFRIDKASVSEWERAKGQPTVDKLPALDECLNANGEVLRLWGIIPRGDVRAPVDLPTDATAKLDAILAAIVDHRASDVAPSAHLLDIPTRAEFTAALATLRAELLTGVDAIRAARDVEIDGLLGSVENLDTRLRAVEAPPPKPPAKPQSKQAKPRSAPASKRRTGTSASRTTRSADR